MTDQALPFEGNRDVEGWRHCSACDALERPCSDHAEEVSR